MEMQEFSVTHLKIKVKKDSKEAYLIIAEPLWKELNFDQCTDLLLHAMIHAFLYRKGEKLNSDHSAEFNKIAQQINEKMGGNIRSEKYEFPEHIIERYQPHTWKCKSCAAITRRSKNQQPVKCSFCNCVELVRSDESKFKPKKRQTELSVYQHKETKRTTQSDDDFIDDSELDNYEPRNNICPSCKQRISSRNFHECPKPIEKPVAAPPPPMVKADYHPCPVCSQQIIESEMNSHLDICLQKTPPKLTRDVLDLNNVCLDLGDSEDDIPIHEQKKRNRNPFVNESEQKKKKKKK